MSGLYLVTLKMLVQSATDNLRGLKYLKSSSTAALHGGLSSSRHHLYNIFEPRSISCAEKLSDDLGNTIE